MYFDFGKKIRNFFVRNDKENDNKSKRPHDDISDKDLTSKRRKLEENHDSEAVTASWLSLLSPFKGFTDWIVTQKNTVAQSNVFKQLFVAPYEFTKRIGIASEGERKTESLQVKGPLGPIGDFRFYGPAMFSSQQQSGYNFGNSCLDLNRPGIFQFRSNFESMPGSVSQAMTGSPKKVTSLFESSSVFATSLGGSLRGGGKQSVGTPRPAGPTVASRQFGPAGKSRQHGPADARGKKNRNTFAASLRERRTVVELNAQRKEKQTYSDLVNCFMRCGAVPFDGNTSGRITPPMATTASQPLVPSVTTLWAGNRSNVCDMWTRSTIDSATGTGLLNRPSIGHTVDRINIPQEKRDYAPVTMTVRPNKSLSLTQVTDEFSRLTTNSLNRQCVEERREIGEDREKRGKGRGLFDPPFHCQEEESQICTLRPRVTVTSEVKPGVGVTSGSEVVANGIFSPPFHARREEFENFDNDCLFVDESFISPITPYEPSLKKPKMPTRSLLSRKETDKIVSVDDVGSADDVMVLGQWGRRGRRMEEGKAGKEVSDDVLITKVELPDSVRSGFSALSSISSEEFKQKLFMSPYSNKDWISDWKEKQSHEQKEKERSMREEESRLEYFREQRKEIDEQLENRMKQKLHLSSRLPVVLSEDEYEEEEEEIEEDESEEEDTLNEFPDLDEDQWGMVDRALVPRPADETLVFAFKLDIHRRDMATLNNSQWLNDEIINYYMSLIMERGGKNNYPSVHAFNTFFYPTIMDKGFDGVKRWTRKINIFQNDYVLIPVHLGVHWCLAVIDFRQKEIRYYDSMNGNNMRCLTALRDYLQAESVDKLKKQLDTSDWKLLCVKGIPQQMNGSDCGMFACKFAEYITRDAPITFAQDHMTYFRRRMVYEILTQKLL